MLACTDILEKTLGKYCAVDLLAKVSAFLNVSVSYFKKYSVLEYMLIQPLAGIILVTFSHVDILNNISPM